MRYFYLNPKDQYYNNWIFYKEDEKSTPALKLRPKYVPLRCSGCGKFDEDKALEMGIDEDVRIRAKTDILLTNDGLICVSGRFIDLYNLNQLRGLTFRELPSGNNYQIATPLTVSTDVARASFMFDKRCDKCGRFAGVYVLPPVAALEVPADPLTIFAPDVWLESNYARVTWLLISELVASIFKTEKLTGVTYLPA